jgi:hypothetical protein
MGDDAIALKNYDLYFGDTLNFKVTLYQYNRMYWISCSHEPQYKSEFWWEAYPYRRAGLFWGNSTRDGNRVSSREEAEAMLKDWVKDMGHMRMPCELKEVAPVDYCGKMKTCEKINWKEVSNENDT